MSTRACRGATWWRAWCACGGPARSARRRARAAPEGCRQRRRITTTGTEGDPRGRGCGRAGAGGPAQRVGEASGRAPNRTGAAVAPVAPACAQALLRRHWATPPLPKGSTRWVRAGSTESVSARLAFGWRQHRARPPLLRRRSPRTVGWRDRGGRVRCYFGAAVRARGTVGWRPCRRRSIGRVRRYFGAAVRARGTVGWRACRLRSIGRVRRYFGAAVRARGTVGWRPCRLRSIGRVRCYFGAAARGTVGWRPCRRRSIGRFRRYFGAAVGARGTVGWRACRLRSIGRVRRYFGAAVGAPARLDGARAGGAPSGASVATSAPKFACRHRGAGHAGRYFGAAAGTRRPLTADQAARQPERRPPPRRLASLRGQANRARRSPLRRRSPPSARSPAVDRPTHQPGQRHTRPAILPAAATNLRLGATFPRRSGATSGYATVVAAVIAIRSPAGAAPLPICCRSTTCCPSPRAVARSRPTWFYSALLITECATATARRCRRNPRCSASSARLARRSAAPADSNPSQRREPSVHLRYRLFRPGPIAVDALTRAVVAVSRQRFPAASGVRTSSNATY